MEIIAIAGLEQEEYGTNLLQERSDFKELMHYGNQLNRDALTVIRGENDPQLEAWAKDNHVSDAALQAAIAVMRASER